MSNFSFSHSVYKKVVLQTQKPGLVWKRVKLSTAKSGAGKKDCSLPYDSLSCYTVLNSLPNDKI